MNEAKIFLNIPEPFKQILSKLNDPSKGIYYRIMPLSNYDAEPMGGLTIFPVPDDIYNQLVENLVENNELY